MAGNSQQAPQTDTDLGQFLMEWRRAQLTLLNVIETFAQTAGVLEGVSALGVSAGSVVWAIAFGPANVVARATNTISRRNL